MDKYGRQHRHFDIILKHDVNAVIEEGDWEYVLSSLNYIQESIMSYPQGNAEYVFKTSNGIQFATKERGVYMVFPKECIEHRLPESSLEKLITALDLAINVAKKNK